MKPTRFATFGMGLLGVVGCSAPHREYREPSEVNAVAAAVVYGDDGRTDYFALTEGPIKDAVAHSVVTLMAHGDARSLSLGRLAEQSPTLAEARGLCEGEAFAGEPTAGLCTGVLLAEDLVLTAGHCVPSPEVCDQLAVVFGYYNDQSMQLHRPSEADVFSCAQLVLRQQRARPTFLDFAVLRLDRSALPAHRVIQLRGSAALDVRADYALVASGWGLPLKSDLDVAVLDPRSAQSDYALVTADAFEGSSGGPLLDAEARLVGYAIAGESDWVKHETGCLAVNRLAKDCADCRVGGERIAYLAPAIGALCQQGYVEFCGDRGVNAGRAPDAGRGSRIGEQVDRGSGPDAGSDFASARSQGLQCAMAARGPLGIEGAVLLLGGLSACARRRRRPGFAASQLGCAQSLERRQINVRPIQVTPTYARSSMREPPSTSSHA